MRILGQNHLKGKQADQTIKAIQKVVIIIGKKAEDMVDVPCGNTCSLFWIDEAFLKQGNIITFPKAHIIKSMKYFVSLIVRVSVIQKSSWFTKISFK